MNRRHLVALLVAAPLIAGAAQVHAQPAPPPGYPPGAIVPPGPEMYAPGAPPAVRVEPVPPHPGGAMVWHPGHWQWEPHRREWVWLSGAYVERPHRLAVWDPGHWVQRRFGWTWVPGHWK